MSFLLSLSSVGFYPSFSWPRKYDKNGSNEANQLKVGMKKHGNKLTYFTISQLIIVDNENKILALNFNVHSTHLQFIKN